MAATFIEGDGGAILSSWGLVGGANTATDFLHGTRQRSIKYAPNTSQYIVTPGGIVANTGGIFSEWFYFVALPTGTVDFLNILNSSSQIICELQITSTGTLKLKNTNSSAIMGTSGVVITTGTWIRISLAFTMTSTSVNRFELFVNGVSTLSITNSTGLGTFVADRIKQGNISTDLTLDFRTSDMCVDASSSLTDPGNIWVTQRRAFSNGTTNSFTTQIGAGSSGYGSGHALQVNSTTFNQTTNGWSGIASNTEEYNLEAITAGVDLSNATIVDWFGYLYTKCSVSAAASIIVGGNSSAISLTTAATLFTKSAGSTSYPAGTGSDIGITSSATAGTYSLYDAGVNIAYIPSTGYTLIFGAGTFTISPSNLLLAYGRKLIFGAASFLVTLGSLALSEFHKIVFGPATYSISSSGWDMSKTSASSSTESILSGLDPRKFFFWLFRRMR